MKFPHPNHAPHIVIPNLAIEAHRIAFHAGVGGCETAGMIISFLAANPDRIDTFLEHGWLEAVGHRDPWADGCLTFYRRDGVIGTPNDLKVARMAKALALLRRNRDYDMRGA